MEGGRLAVAFKLRSPDTALLDFHTALIAAGKQIEARYLSLLVPVTAALASLRIGISMSLA